jgi:hypothetical protein
MNKFENLINISIAFKKMFILVMGSLIPAFIPNALWNQG